MNKDGQIPARGFYCADCGSRLYYHADPNGNTAKDYYKCGKYSQGHHECSVHSIREDGLRKLVLTRIQNMMVYAASDAVDFAEAWQVSRNTRQLQELRQVQKQLAQSQKRSEEIDSLLMRTYEDYAKGILTLERYRKLSDGYEAEQQTLTVEIQSLEQTIRHRQESQDSFGRFMELIAKYVGLTELTPTIVNEFVHKIIVHEADKSSGPRVQQVDIVFNFIADLDIPAVANQDIPAINQSIPVSRNTQNEKTA